ncbi:hypothetical protein [Novosphingobium sp.]|uniref:hypothetical protein n=1 Tax=Novosphingobium sp. TaxID=1874826 RepID=UPI0038BE0EF9
MTSPIPGGKISRSSLNAALAIGIISGMIPALQGSLLPQLVDDGRLSLSGIGGVATAEAAGTLIAIMLANSFLKPQSIRMIAFFVSICGLLIDFITADLIEGQIVAARFVHGICAGVLLWVWIGVLTRIENPTRIIAAYVTGQAILLLALSSFFASYLLPWGGAGAGFAALASLYAVMAGLAFLVPDRLAPFTQGSASIMPNRAGWIGLFIVFLQLAAILGLWIYVKPLGQMIGLDNIATGTAISVALGAQIFAGLGTGLLADRISPRLALTLVGTGSVVAIAALAVAHSPLQFTAAVTAFAFLWMLAPPFQMPYLITLDPSRRAAMHIATAQLVGVTAGPALASMAVNALDARGALLVSGSLYALSVVCIRAERLWRTDMTFSHPSA